MTSSIMDFRTQVSWDNTGLWLHPEQRMLLLGSCFSSHIGHFFGEALFAVRANPFGVLYNPSSIAVALRLLVHYEECGMLPQHIFFKDSAGQWGCYWADTSFTRPTLAACQAAVQDTITQAAHWLQTTDVLFVTWGTRRTYVLSTDEEDPCVVANCHKQPASSFTIHDLSVSEIVHTWTSLLHDLFALRPTLQVVFTVSPYRYLKYGLHGNQLSKAALLLAIEALTSAFTQQVHYFPAYELITDELRDYRFYEADMVHPTRQAAQYVWQQLCEWTFPPSTQQYVRQANKLSARVAHRATHGIHSPAYQSFLSQTYAAFSVFSTQYPFAPVQDIMQSLAAILTPPTDTTPSLS